MKTCDILIVGAGVAGMTAGIYGLRAKKSVIIAEKMTAGGQVLNTTKIENYPGLPSISGKDLAKTLREQVENFGGEIISAEVLKIEQNEDGFKATTDDEEILAKTIILANGSRERRLGLESEEKFIGKGISYCATCDGALYRDKTVAVYGGGNTSAYSAMYLSGIAKKVYWIFRKPEPRAEKHLVEKIREIPNVEILSSREIVDFSGEESLKCIYCKNNDEASSDLAPIDVDGLFVTIGREADNGKFANLVELNKDGYIKSDETCKTSLPGVFCAGDTRAKKLHQIVTATADGAVSATLAIEYLNN